MFNRGYIKKILKKQKTPNYIDVMKIYVYQLKLKRKIKYTRKKHKN